ncbi:hypothetical protein [Bradyrhizobium elkanii]|uniref:hypothetical protein n=1 Tax=Bradyrhizobium elkanii TaxID=29448 RepID=UPI00155A32F3|nr:hypothetical protein [Bradyrhizobium elkanii]
MPVANTEERLLALLATLEECQAFLTDRANTETARLLSRAGPANSDSSLSGFSA